MRKITAMLLVCLILLGVAPVQASAVQAESVSLDKSLVNCYVGDSITLGLTVMPQEAQSMEKNWTTSDANVVSLTNGGELLAVGEGSARITVTVGDKSAFCNIVVSPLKTITVTQGAKAQLFLQNNYYNYTELEAVKVESNTETGTDTYYFRSKSTDNNSWRVSKEGKVTKAGYWETGTTAITVLYTGADAAPTARPVYASAGQANSAVAEDSVLLNINSRNHLVMAVGEERTLKAYRAWEIIMQDASNHVIMPDFQYKILSGSDVVQLTERKAPLNGDSGWRTVKGLKNGVAVIEVTYDAIDISGGSYPGLYGASDPSRTGLVVIQVGGADPAVDFGIDGFSSIGSSTDENILYDEENKRAWDAEFDTLYFTEPKGSLTFHPTANGKEILEAAVSNDNGSNWTVLNGNNGTYTATIVPGNNILRVKTATGTAYQVVRGDRLQVSVTEVRETGKSDSDGLVEAGETVRVRLQGIHMPIPKISGNYNPGYNSKEYGRLAVHLNYTCGTSAIYGPGAQYNFITTANYLDVQIPANATDNVSLTDGYIGFGVMGYADLIDSTNGHRTIPDEGCSMLYGYATLHTRSVLPNITISLNTAASANSAPVVKGGAVSTASIRLNQNFAINPETLFTDPDGDNLTYTVSENGGAEKSAAATYKYTPGSTGTHTLTFTATDGKSSVRHTITLTVNPASQTSTQTEFGLNQSEIAGYVYISFEDNGVRVAGEKGLKIPQALGTIIPQTRVPFKQGETVAQVTLRLLDARGIRYTYTGTPTTNFYLAALLNVEVNNTPYSSIGEFDAGSGSGWMITQNGIFIDKSAGMFKVSKNDTIRWQYTCQLGADIGDNRLTAGSNSTSGTNSNTSAGVNTADKKKAAAVEKLIQALPDTITVSQQKQVQEAADAYDALTAAQKDLVSETLVKKLDEARRTIAKLVATQQDKDAANSVMQLIEKLPAVVTADNQKQIQAARDAYNKLTQTQKYLVDNYEKLENAENQLKKLSTGSLEEINVNTENYLKTLGIPTVNSVGGEWMVLGLARSGLEVPEGYYDNVLNFVRENINEKGQLHRAKSTENSRLILALTAIGKDVTDVGGYNLLKGLTDLEYVCYQGINGPIWALIAFDSGNYAIPEGGNVTREVLIQTILKAQLSDGGWALTGSVSDPDMTAMAVQSLASYAERNDEVEKAVESAVIAMSRMQHEDGSFAGQDGVCSESIAQVVVALAALGIDADTDARFIKNGISALDALLNYAVPGGGFRHILEGDLDGMATEQAYYALVAYDRMKQNKSFLYDMTDVIDRGGNELVRESLEFGENHVAPVVEAQKDSGNMIVIWIGVIVLCLATIVLILLNRKKTSGKIL